jgi:hypothetical protein
MAPKRRPPPRAARARMKTFSDPWTGVARSAADRARARGLPLGGPAGRPAPARIGHLARGPRPTREVGLALLKMPLSYSNSRGRAAFLSIRVRRRFISQRCPGMAAREQRGGGRLWPYSGRVGSCQFLN